MKKFYPLIFILGLIFTVSCLKDKTPEPGEPGPIDPCSTIVSYSVDIVPIIDNSCRVGCHDSWLNDYPQIAGRIDNGTFQSRVLDLKDMPQMPNGFGVDSLTATELQTIDCWIAQGYPEN